MGKRSTLLFLALLLVLLPLVQRPLVAAEILVLGLAALATNILLGYTGMLSFGQAMFFGLGAYVCGLLIAKIGLSAFLAIPIATFSAGLAALLVGVVCVRRTGLYFICITFAFNQMFYFVAYSVPAMTGGEDGLPGVDRPAILQDPLVFYLFAAAVFVVAFLILKRFVESPTGRILQAIRDNPSRAAATGHDIGRYKLIAFTVSGLFTGLAGAVFALVFELVPIDKINWMFSGDLVFMTLIGGARSFVGPVVGAAFYTYLQETVSLFFDRWPMVLGLVFAAVVLFFRGGIAGAAEHALARLRLDSRQGKSI